MIIIKDPSNLQLYLSKYRQNGEKIGFVPTMGALHEGHVELVRQASSSADIIICSIFVNPTQFNDPRDFEKYPITLEQDIIALEAAHTDILFLPSVSQLYPNGTIKLEKYELGYLETILEGFYRPGHFQGVCQVMRRLLDAVKPDLLFMGQKDYQQCMVVKKLMELMKYDTQLITCPTVRETDGLAMSSRNKRLNKQERDNAIGIYKALSQIKENSGRASVEQVKKEALKILEQHHFKVDYVEIAGADTLEILKEWNKQQKHVALIAAFQGDVRLIDNMAINS